MFVEKYLQWLQNITEAECSNEWYEITTPFSDCRNDGIIVYVKEKNGLVYISDDKYFFDELGILQGLFQEKEVREFFRIQNITITEEKELQTITTLNLFPIVLHKFIQAIAVASRFFCT